MTTREFQVAEDAERRVCRDCNEKKVFVFARYRRTIGKQIKIFKDETGKFWDGKSCPSCMKVKGK